MTPKHNDVSHAATRKAIRAYVDRWEAWEQENGKEASIPAIEWNALMALTKSTFEQDTDNTNYVGILNERQPFIGAITKLEDQQFPDPLTNAMCFRTSFLLPDGRGVFPREGYGFQAGEEPPSFPQKKRAKQFAAKCALAWLNDNPIWPNAESSTTNNTPSNGKSDHPAPSASPSPVVKKVKVRDAEDQQGAHVSPPSPTLPPSTTATVKPTPPSSWPSSEDSSVSIRKLVDSLARKLGFDAPRYMVELHVDGTFSGHPMFVHDGRMPKDLGVITGATSESQAKTEVAQKVLMWLLEKQQTMDADIDKLLGEVMD